MFRRERRSGKKEINSARGLLREARGPDLHGLIS
jgi:hypothetical protein